MKYKIAFFVLIILAALSLFGQNPMVPQRYAQQTYPRSGEKFITDQFGVIRMYVNVWGHVNEPGSHLVYDGIDLASLLSMTGGPKTGANMKKVRLYRAEPDENGQLVYVIDMKKFLKSGNRDDFVPLKPNDTIIIKQTIPSYVTSNMGVVSTIMSILYFYSLVQKNI
ncbi:SLBB domain-containing protein [bacterium]|nr:SLBB domain-containing protein [bacterium]